jgi:predicted nucleic acid-binding protein
VSRFVCDSFALLAWHWHEPGGLRVRQLMRSENHQFWMSVINLGEMYYRIAAEDGRKAAEDALKWTARIGGLSIVDANRSLTIEAAKIKSAYPISYADAFAAALTIRQNASLMTGDPEFLPLERDGVLNITWLR